MNKNKLYAMGMAAVLFAAALILTGCPDPNNAAAPQTVEAKYRFSSGDWYEVTDGSPSCVGVATLGENSFTVTGSVSISYAGVYTAGGGTYVDNNRSGAWTYLYAPTGKIGIVICFDSDGVVVVFLGKTQIEDYMATPSVEYEPSLDAAGMQNTHNGYAFGFLS
jgi:hypothetical protein